jgi:hypothetical protein
MLSQLFSRNFSSVRRRNVRKKKAIRYIERLERRAMLSASADFDGDTDVDGADFVVWQTNFPKTSGATKATGDADNDGDVDGADFITWQTAYPTTGTASEFNVKSSLYGAVGDGINDDTAAIQAAIDDAVNAGGGIVKIPTGTYKLTSSLAVREGQNVEIVGDGKGLTVLKSYGAYPSYLLGSTSTAATVLFAASFNCAVRNLTVDRREITDIANGIALWYDAIGEGTPCKNIDVVNCEVYGPPDMHTYNIWSLNAEHVRILNCDVDGGTPSDRMGTSGAEGIEVFGGYDVLVQGNRVKNVDGSGIHLFQAHSFSSLSTSAITVVDNHVQDCYRGIGIIGQATGGQRAIQVTGNTVIDCDERGVALLLNADSLAQDIIIAQNHIENCVEGITLFGEDGLTTSNILISGNTLRGITSVEQGAILLVNVSQIQISNNQIDETTNQSIRLLNASHIQVSNNSSNDAGDKHLQIWNSSHVSVSENYFGDYASDAAAARVDAASSDIDVINNTFFKTGSDGYAVFLAGVTRGSIIGNQLVGGSTFHPHPYPFFVAGDSSDIQVHGNDGSPTALTAYGSGAAYQITVIPAAIEMGTISPAITLEPGTWKLRSSIVLDYNAATFAAISTVTVNLHRINAEADIENSSISAATSIVTNAFGTFTMLQLPEVVYSTQGSTVSGDADIIVPFISLSIAPLSGSLDVVSCSLIAERIPS